MGYAGKEARVELIWVEPALAGPSGGSRYNHQVRAALGELGVEVRLLSADGQWPHPAPDQVTDLQRQLGAHRARHHRDTTVLVDGLVGSCCPELFDGQHPMADALLMHLPLTAEPGADPQLNALERRAVHGARAVVVTSRWAAADLTGRYGRTEIGIAEPGVHRPAGLPPEEQGRAAERGRAGGQRPPSWVCVGSLTPRKNHALLGQALQPLLDDEWELVLAGPGAQTRFGAQTLAVLQHQLPGRVRYVGTLDGDEVSELWSQADLLLLPSLAETYGMVVTEACAYGVPAFVSAGTGAEEAAGLGSGWPAGVALDPKAPGDWTQQLRLWLTDEGERERLARAALDRSVRLPAWSSTASQILKIVGSLPSG